MSWLTSLALFAVLIIILSTLRARLLYEMLAISLLLVRNSLYGKWLYSIFFLPGTILHELSHWLTAELIGVRTGEIKIMPEFRETTGESRERLGSVATANSGPVRSFLIGAAPFFTGLGSLWILGTLLQSEGWLLWQYLLILYGIIVVGSSMLLSAEDRRSWLPIAILATVIGVLIYLLEVPINLGSLLERPLTELNRILILTVGAISAMIGLSYLLRRIIEKILGKEVITR